MGGLAHANEVDLRILAEEGKKARIKLARNGHLKSFCELVMIDEETGRGIDMAPVHMAWHTLADEYNRLLIWAHVESGKTQQMAVARTLWDLGHNHNLRTAIVSNTKGQAVKVARAIKSYIEGSDNLHAIFPDLLPGRPWGEQQFSIQRKTHAKDPSVQCAGVHGNILGSRIDRLVLDDILDYENTRTAHARNDLKHWYKSTLGGRLTKDSSIRSIGTAWHPEDLLHEFAKSRLWKAYVYPVVNAEGEPRWPERWTKQRIADKLEELGPVEFSRQMLCQARDDSSAIFKREWIERCLTLGDGRTMATALSVLPRGYSTYTGVDLAVQKHDAADYTCLFTIAVDPFGNRHVLEIDTGRWSGPEIVLKIQSVHRRFQSIVIVENNACFPTGEKVLTKEGYKPIETIEVGTEVLTHKGNWKKVLERTSRPFEGNLCIVKPAGLPAVRCTPNHAFWARESGRVKGSRTAPDVGKHRPVGAPGWQSACVLREAGHYVATPIASWAGCAPSFEVERYGVQRSVGVDEELALFIGLWLADGTCSRPGQQPSQVNFAIAADQLYLKDFVHKVAKEKFGATVTDFSVPGQASVTSSVNSIEAKRFFECFGRSDRKRLPWEFMGWPKSLRLAILRGWLLGDGSLCQNNAKSKTPSWIFRASSISRDLVLQMRMTALQVGLTPTMSSIPARISKIGDRTINSKASTGLAFNSSDTQVLLDTNKAVEWQRWPADDSQATTASKSSTVIEDDLAWTKVSKLGPEAYSGLVYNLVVEDDHSYVVGDLAVHNSQDFILQFARGASAVPVRAFTTGRNKAHPAHGVQSLATEMYNGKWFIPNMAGAMSPEASSWIDEMLYYDPAGHTGDRLMASWFAREGSRMGQKKVKTRTNVDLLRR